MPRTKYRLDRGGRSENAKLFLFIKNMIYNLICKLKDKEFKYKVEADNHTEAMVKVREHIKNSVEISIYKKPPKKTIQDFFKGFSN